jgi:hypothetical protein
MKIIVTANDLIDKGVWDEACDILGLNIWAVNERLMDSNEEIILTEDQAAKLGLKI